MKSASFNKNQLPLGQRIPDSQHGVSVNLPTFADVIGYEEKDPRTMNYVCSGYPRFVSHPYILQLAKAYSTEHSLDENQHVLFFSSSAALQDAINLHPQFSKIETDNFHDVALVVVHNKSEEHQAFSSYLQHTGTGLSSREAEDLLIELRAIDSRYTDEKTIAADSEHLKELIYQWFDPAYKASILPCKSGMNAFYASFQAINKLQTNLSPTRKNWISIGWLYVDTLAILDKYLIKGGETIWFKNVNQTDQIIRYIEESGDQVAGLILEAPTNPLVQTPDVEKIHEACHRAGIISVMDPSLVSPQNVDLSPYCDILCCSLTKYAAHDGDIMIGSALVKMGQKHSKALEALMINAVTAPYHRDLSRLGACLENATAVMKQINANTMTLANYFEQHPKVERVFWAYAKDSADHYRKIHRSSERPGGVMTLQLKDDIEDFYNRLPLPKGPSFGTSFTFLCAYIHLAHYDLLQSEKGLSLLKEAGINNRMIRFSIGTEDPQDLIKMFDNAL